MRLKRSWCRFVVKGSSWSGASWSPLSNVIPVFCMPACFDPCILTTPHPLLHLGLGTSLPYISKQQCQQYIFYLRFSLSYMGSAIASCFGLYSLCLTSKPFVMQLRKFVCKTPNTTRESGLIDARTKTVGCRCVKDSLAGAIVRFYSGDRLPMFCFGCASYLAYHCQNLHLPSLLSYTEVDALLSYLQPTLMRA